MSFLSVKVLSWGIREKGREGKKGMDVTEGSSTAGGWTGTTPTQKDQKKNEKGV